MHSNDESTNERRTLLSMKWDFLQQQKRSPKDQSKTRMRTVDASRTSNINVNLETFDMASGIRRQEMLRDRVNSVLMRDSGHVGVTVPEVIVVTGTERQES